MEVVEASMQVVQASVTSMRFFTASVETPLPWKLEASIKVCSGTFCESVMKVAVGALMETSEERHSIPLASAHFFLF